MTGAVIPQKKGADAVEPYLTVERRANAEFIEKRSRFIGYICPVKNEQAAAGFIGEIKKKHYDATHNVYADHLRESSIRRFSDDGEPQGTAGMPVLDVLMKENVTDCVVVVTRYFGGTMLGAGGLVRAYSHGAKIALDAGGIVMMEPHSIYRTAVGYGMYDKLISVVAKHGGAIRKNVFEAEVSLEIGVSKEQEEALLKLVRESTNGTVVLTPAGECYLAKSVGGFSENIKT